MSMILGLHATSSVRPKEGSIPRLASVKRVTLDPDRNSRLVFLTEPAGLAVERYKILRRRLCTLHPRGGVVLVTSPNPGEGKTLTSVNLAWSLGEAGQSTCLVDLDFRAPSFSRTLGYSFEDGGVEEVLDGRTGTYDVIRQLGDRPLYVLGIKKRIASPGHLLASQSLAAMVGDLRDMFTWIILDFAPVIPMSDVLEVIPHIDGAIMAVRVGQTEKSIIEPAIEILESKLWGVVANDCPIEGSAYYGSYGA